MLCSGKLKLVEQYGSKPRISEVFGNVLSSKTEGVGWIKEIKIEEEVLLVQVFINQFVTQELSE